MSDDGVSKVSMVVRATDPNEIHVIIRPHTSEDLGRGACVSTSYWKQDGTLMLTFNEEFMAWLANEYKAIKAEEAKAKEVASA